MFKKFKKKNLVFILTVSTSLIGAALFFFGLWHLMLYLTNNLRNILNSCCFAPWSATADVIYFLPVIFLSAETSNSKEHFWEILFYMFEKSCIIIYSMLLFHVRFNDAPCLLNQACFFNVRYKEMDTAVLKFSKFCHCNTEAVRAFF